MTNAPIKYLPDFLPPRLATQMYDHLRNNLDWLSVTDARKEYWTNDFDTPYTYGSGRGVRTYEAQPMDARIDAIRSEARCYWQDANRDSARWEGCFLNLYEEFKHALDWHSDDDPKIDHDQPIAVVSLGAERAITFRPMDDNDPKLIQKQVLGHGSLLLMLPGMQHSWKHKIPRADSTSVGPRISLTYRSLRS